MGRGAILAVLGVVALAIGAAFYFFGAPDQAPPPAMEKQAEGVQPAAPSETATASAEAQPAAPEPASAEPAQPTAAESQSESTAPAPEAQPAPAEQVAAAETVAEPEPEPAATATAPEQPGTVPEAQSTAPAVEQQAALPEQPATAAPAAPQFDIVRVEPDGATVVAGRAEPGAKVTLYDGETAIGSVVADGNGEWVIVPGKPLPPGSRELSLVAEMPGGQKVPSDKVVILAVPEPRVVVAQESGSETQSAEPAAPLAVLATRQGNEPSQVLQQPESEGLSDRDLVLRAVDYDAEGNVIISGEAAANATVYVYLDEQPIGRTAADEQGRWDLRPDSPVQPGLHRLRIDQIGPDGSVLARIETPFSRAAILTDLPGERFVIVQPGNSLWRIARRSYGEGTQYSVIYQSNADQIRDPDLIYPGQIFLVPTIN